MQPTPFVSVVVPAHNEERYLADCLHSLLNQDYPSEFIEILVVDNNSSDRTSEVAASLNVTVLFKEKGPVGAVRNYGVAHSKGEILAFIDGDCVAPVDWIRKGVELLQTNVHAAYGGRCVLRKNPFWLEKFWLLEGDGPKAPPAELLGCSIFIRKNTFENCGMFDETVTSGEDSKLSITIRQQGLTVGFSQLLDVAHLGNPTDSATFFKRQVWHSENYLKDLRVSMRDKTFILAVLFYITGVASLVTAASGQVKLSLLCLSIFLFVPAIFSARRMIAARYKPSNFGSLASIYYLDFVYLVARCTGITKSFVDIFKNRQAS